MKKYFISLFFISLIINNVLAQVLVQDATGSSSLLYQGSTINIDVAQARTSFSINKFFNEGKSDTARLFLGLQASANSKNGFANVLKTGTFVPSADLKGTIGVTWTKGQNQNTLLSKEKDLAMAENRALELARNSDVNDAVLEATLNLSTPALKKSVNDINSVETAADMPTKLKNLLTSPVPELNAKSTKNDTANVEAIITNNAILGVLIKKIESISKDYEVKSTLVNRMVDSISSEISRRFWLKRYVLYGILGGSASEFTYLKDKDNKDYKSRFVDTTFKSPKFGFGFNMQNGGNSIWGFSFTFEKADNFSILDDREHTITNTDQVSNTVETINSDGKKVSVITDNIVSKKTFNAYEGAYDTYRRITADIDYAHFFPGRVNDKSVLVLHGYIRQIFSRKSEIFPEITKIGTGLYTFRDNGTFTGGIYIELNDVFNNIEIMKPKPELKPFYNRISFGIITKFALSSIISYR